MPGRVQRYDAPLNYEITIPRWKFELWRLVAWVLGCIGFIVTLGVVVALTQDVVVSLR